MKQLAKPIALLLIAFVSLVNNLQAQETLFWPRDYNRQYTPHVNDIEDGYYHLLYEEQVNLASQTIGVRYAMKVVNETGLSNISSVEIGYDSTYQTLDLHHVHIIRDGRVIDVLKKQTPEILRREPMLESGIISGMLTSYLEVKDLRVGDILEYAFVRKGFNPIKKDFFRIDYTTSYSVPVGEVFIKFFTDAPENCTYQLINGEKEPVIAKEKGLTSYTWKVTDPEIIPYEGDVPSWYSPYRKVIFANKTNWTEVAEHLSMLYMHHDPLSSDLKDFIAQHKTISNNKERALALVQYVQNDIRYLGVETGVHGYKPRQPNEIFESKAGDCKEKSWLLSILLQECGFNAFPVLVNTYEGKLLPERPAGIESFDHCITALTINDDTIFIDPTYSQQGGTLDNLQTPNYHYALPLLSPTKTLVSMPSKTNYQTHITETFHIEDYSGKAILEVKTVYSDSEADNQRSYFAMNSAKDVQKEFLRFYANVFPRIDTVNCLVVTDNKEENKLTVTEKYQIEQVWQKGDSLATMETITVWAGSMSHSIAKTHYPNRKAPLFLLNNHHITQEIILNLPEDWSADNDETNISGPGFEYSRKTRHKGKKIHYIFDYKTSKDQVANADYMDFIDKHATITDDLEYSINHYLNAYAAKSKLNLQFLMIAIFTCVIGIFFLHKLYLYDPAPEKQTVHGQPIGGWLVLIAIGITISPLVLGFNVLGGGYLSNETFGHFTSPDSPSYSVTWTLFIMLELILNILFTLFTVLLAILFYQRRSSFPKLFITFLVSNFLFITADSIVAFMLAPDQINSAETIAEIAKRLIGVMIWVPYFTLSERVKDTFVKQRIPMKQNEQEQLVERA